MNHFADPVDANQLAYERRVRELSSNKVTKSHLNSKVLETWINETLNDAGHLDIPGVILKPESKKPLTRYGIDRDQMLLGRVPTVAIDRIYRALFVYSLGFYEMVTKALVQSPSKNSFQSAIWKVFAILLEYCCKTNYQMLVGKMQAEHRQQLEIQEKEYTEQQDKMYENEKNMMEELDELSKEN